MFGLDTKRTFDTMTAVRRTRVRRSRLAATLASAAAIGALWGPLTRVGRPELRVTAVAAHRYVVRPGDTLWSIAKRLAPGRDPREIVDALEAVNHVDPGHLVPGSTLLVTSET